MFTFGLTGSGPGFDPLILLLIAIAIEAYVGEIRFLFKVVPHPVRIIDTLARTLDRKLNREHRSDMDRAIRGALVVLVVAAGAAAAGWGIAWLSQNIPFLWAVELVLLMALIAHRAPYDRVRVVVKALADEGLEPARAAVSGLVRRDPGGLDEYGVARAAIEAAATDFAKGAVAPVFWYVLFGFPGLLVYTAVRTMDTLIGQRTPGYRAFGFAAARLDDALTLIPARLAGLLVVAAAVFVPKAHPGRALAVMVRDAGKHPSLNAGWPQGAMAGALDLALAGPRRYARQTVNQPWIGTGSARVTTLDMSRALYLYAVACLINVMWVAAVAIVRFSLPG
jgi:adenosylcobinamide-phosphate synthase